MPNVNNTVAKGKTMENGKCRPVRSIKRKHFFTPLFICLDCVVNVMSDYSDQVVPNAVACNDATATKSSSLPPTPAKQSKAMKRPQKDLTSKFNQSTRKSDKLATFYFKHPDTEGSEGGNGQTDGDWSSQDVSEIYSEDEQWVYEEGKEKAENGDETLKEAELSVNISDNLDLTHLSTQVNCNESIGCDAVDSPLIMKQV